MPRLPRGRHRRHRASSGARLVPAAPRGGAPGRPPDAAGRRRGRHHGRRSGIPRAGRLDPRALEGVDAVVHLAGRASRRAAGPPPVMKRIRRSRVDGTRLLSRDARQPRAPAARARLGVRRRVLRGPAARRRSPRRQRSGRRFPGGRLPRVGGGGRRRAVAGIRVVTRASAASSLSRAGAFAADGARSGSGRAAWSATAASTGAGSSSGDLVRVDRALPRARRPRRAGQRRRRRRRPPTASSRARWQVLGRRRSCHSRPSRSGSSSGEMAGRSSSTARVAAAPRARGIPLPAPRLEDAPRRARAEARRRPA